MNPTINSDMRSLLDQKLRDYSITNIINHNNGKISVTIEAKLYGNSKQIFSATGITLANVAQQLIEQYTFTTSTLNNARIQRVVMSVFL